MLDIDGLLSELERVLEDVVKLATEGGGWKERTRVYGMGGMGDELKVTTSVRVGFLDEVLSGQAPPPSVEREPMIDVMQTKEGLKVLVLLPGVEKEDIKAFARGRSLVFEINSRGRSYRREIPCDLPPSKVSIKSMVQNNSVVEITFAAKEK
ncbi:MAG TPA: Hsp20/alpha crystallin family protein [Nitrososphaerales archaeon]|nr:Hsp20/alpha crystallin family protein [Nitrososphaerales archaeon]